MKTLNEVIKAIEWCTELDQSGCGACPYADDADNRCYADDALHYLKEYQERMTDTDGDHQQLEKCRALLQDFYRNDPLTWTELRTMEGKPVWVEHALTKFKGWILLNRYENSFLVDVMDEWYLSENSIGKTWQAYRKERK